MDWWAWLIMGLVLMAVEMGTPGGFVALFFGIGAVLVAILVGLGMSGPPWLQWVLFAVFSVILLLVLRRYFRTHLTQVQKPVDSVVGEEALLQEDLQPDAVGKAELRGSLWNAKNVSQYLIKKSQRCTVEKVDGLTLWIRPK